MDNNLTPRILIEMRKATGISQIRLSRLTGVSRFRITMFECGYNDLTQEEALRLLEFLKCQALRKGGVL